MMIIGLVLTTNSFSQTAGLTSYRYLSFNPSARVAALGGSTPSIFENDVNLTVQNPSLLRSEMHMQTGISHAFYLAGIQAGLVSYAYAIDSNSTLGFGLQYVNYGSFTQTEANGEITGTFTAGDYAFSMAYSRKLSDYLRIGGQFKGIYSTLAGYNSTAIAIDAGLTYHNPERLLTMSVVVSNVGKQLTTYSGSNSEELPFNLQFGLSKKLKNAPFRFTLTANHLERPGKLVFQNLNKPSLSKDLETGNVIPENLSIINKVMGHVTVGTELLLGKNFYIGFGYNYLRKWEMGLKDVSGAAGLSWGFGFNTMRYHFGYARSAYMIGQSSDHLTMIIRLNKFGKKS